MDFFTKRLERMDWSGKGGDAKRRSYYEDVFNSTAGRVVLADILDVAGLYRMSYDKESQRQTDFNEGKKIIARHIIGALTVPTHSPTTTKPKESL